MVKVATGTKSQADDNRRRAIITKRSEGGRLKVHIQTVRYGKLLADAEAAALKRSRCLFYMGLDYHTIRLMAPLRSSCRCIHLPFSYETAWIISEFPSDNRQFNGPVAT